MEIFWAEPKWTMRMFVIMITKYVIFLKFHLNINSTYDKKLNTCFSSLSKCSQPAVPVLDMTIELSDLLTQWIKMLLTHIIHFSNLQYIKDYSKRWQEIYECYSLAVWQCDSGTLVGYLTLRCCWQIDIFLWRNVGNLQGNKYNLVFR